MKKTFTLAFISCAFLLVSFDVKEASFQKKEHYQNEKWYPALIAGITQQDRADVHSAQWMSHLSSNSAIAFEKSMPKLIEKIGKINEVEIRVLFRESKNDPNIFVFVETTNYVLDLFRFNTITQQLSRVNNKGLIIMHFGDRLSVNTADKNGILFFDDYDVQSTDKFRRNYIYYDRAGNSLKHTKRCETVNGLEQCKPAN